MVASTPLNVQQSLKNLGFSSNEASILVLLFQIKKASTKEISQHTAITLTSVQFAVSNLARKKLVTTIAGHQDSYQICSRKEFKKWITDQQKSHAKIYEEAQEDLEGFFQHTEDSRWQPSVTYYEGKEGIIELYQDMLQTAAKADRNIYSWQDINVVQEAIGEFVNQHIANRKKFKVVSHAILPKKEGTLNIPHKVQGREIKFAENLKINGDIRITGNKVFVVTFDEGKPIGFTFEGKAITALFRSIFDSFWEHLES